MADRSPLDDLFLRFRSRGDLAALGRLFDRTAPDLFRIALTLAPDASAAEDAVQETFLTLLEDAERQDPSRPVLPWLIGILRMKVFELRRRQRRAPRAARLRLPEPPADPWEEVARQDDEEVVREALERLPEPYREVAILRWRYGLEPSEIADAQGRPPGTVRSLLTRALQRLRRELVRLPAFLGFRWPRGLGSVRHEVLRRAATVAPAAAGGSWLLGWWWGKAAGALALVFLGFVTVRGLFPGREPRPPGTAPGPGAAAPVARAPAPPVADAAPPPGGAAPAGPPPAAPAPPAATAAWRAVGRVLDTDGRPVPGAVVTILSLRGAAEDRIGRTTADAEGRYAVELPALARMSPAERAVARIMGHGLAPGHWQESGLLAGTLERRPPGDLRLDLRMTPGTRLTGRVVDRDGKPVPLSAVRLLPEGAPELPPETVTDDEGRYVLGIPRAGRYRVVAALPQAGSGFLDAFDAGPGPDVAAPDLVLRGDGVIEGVVRRPDGAPLGDAMVVALPEWGWRPARRSEWLLPGLRMEEHAHPGTGLTDGEAWTDATGAFRITGVRPGRYCLLALDVDDLHDPPLRVHATGTVASVVVETPRLRVRVRDEGGRALPGAHLFRKGPRGGLDEDVRPASGCVDLSVRAGESWRLVVMVPAFPPVEASFTVPSRGLDHEVELVVRESAPRGSVRVRLQDRAGRAIRRFRTHFHLADGELLMATDSDVESGEDLLEGIPVGRYRLVVHPGRPGRDRWLPVGQDDVEVAAERETAVRLRAERTGGRVRLRVRPPEGATAGQQYSLHVAAVRPGLPVPDKHDLVRRETPSATWLKSYRTAPKGEPEEDPDRASVSTILLEPGPYDLTVRAEGFQRFVRPIVIVEGETVEVEVRLTP